MNIIQLKNISFHYSQIKVLDNICMNVKKGEFLGIIGPNGSGKTTLLNIMSNFLTPDCGRVLLNDRDISSYSTSQTAREIAVVHEQVVLSFSYTVSDIVHMGRRPYLGMFRSEQPEDFEIVNDAMAVTDVYHLRNRPVDHLSSGERQRVFIAQALAQNPGIIFLDEPTSHLDISHEIKIFGLLEKLQHEKKLTVVVVTHNINLISQYSDRLVILKNGVILREGNAHQVITENSMKELYETDVLVSKNPHSRTPHVFLLTHRHLG